MTAMSDVTVLLLTFFMLTSTFIQKEPIQVSTPASVMEIKIPETDILQILVDNDGKGVHEHGQAGRPRGGSGENGRRVRDRIHARRSQQIQVGSVVRGAHRSDEVFLGAARRRAGQDFERLRDSDRQHRQSVESRGSRMPGYRTGICGSPSRRIRLRLILSSIPL